MIERLRPKYSDEELKKIYSTPHAHHHWLDHKARVRSTVDRVRNGKYDKFYGKGI